MDLELRGRTAVVTGCSVGIGREIARVLASEGVAALVVARRGELLKTLQDEIETAGWVRPHALAVDLADRAAPARVRDEAQVAFLCSPRARYITGERIHVDGGLRRAI
ncbi:MAG: SDR family NAD(P)-dependent oxidoreductase [Candidatus Rokuibacteriota bacterium]